MSTVINYFRVLFLFGFVLILVSGCKKDDSNPVENPSATFVGTWKLTNLSTTISGQKISMTPELAGIQMTIVSKQDGSFTMTTVENGTTTNYSGTYSLNGENLTLKYSDGTSVTFAITVSGEKLTIKDYPYNHPQYGSMLITMEFSKQA